MHQANRLADILKRLAKQLTGPLIIRKVPVFCVICGEPDKNVAEMLRAIRRKSFGLSGAVRLEEFTRFKDQSYPQWPKSHSGH